MMANLVLKLPNGLMYSVKTQKVESETIIEKPQIIKKTRKGEDTRSVRKAEGEETQFTKYHYVTQVLKNGEWVDVTKDDEIVDYKINMITGELEEAVPFEHTRLVELSWGLTLPANYAGMLLQEELYEVYGATDVDNIELCKFIDEAIERDVMFIHENFVWRRGYNAYHAIFIPNRDTDGRYSLIMMTTTGKTIYKKKMVPVSAEQLEKAKEVPSLLNTLIG